MAAPHIFVKLIGNASPQGVSVNISDQLQQITVGVQQYRLVSAAEQRAVAMVSAIESLGVNAVDVPHASGEIGIRCLDQEMMVVGQQTEGRNAKIPGLRGFLEKFDKLSVVSFVRENGIAPPPAIHDMVPCTRIFYS